MGSFANTLFSLLLGWAQTLIAALWSTFTSGKAGGFLTWVGEHWIPLAVGLCLAGGLIDLIVYLVRWQPIRVWKSFFRRIRAGGREAEEPEGTEEAEQAAESEGPERPAEMEDRTPGETAAAPAVVPMVPIRADQLEAPIPKRIPAAQDRTASEESDELARWREPAADDRLAGESERVLVTRAGYRVQEDSPYRRPTEPDIEKQEQGQRNREFERRILQSRRRRRITLFSDEEDGFSRPEHVAPDELIDAREAYHQPVYPRKWNQREEKENDSSLQ